MVKSSRSGRVKHDARRGARRALAFFKPLWKFLSFDSYMYGELLRATWEGEAHQLLNKEVRSKKSKLKVTRYVRTTAPGRLFKTAPADGIAAPVDEEQPAAEETTLAYLTVQQHAVATPEARERAVRKTDNANGTGSGLSLNEGNEDSESEQIAPDSNDDADMEENSLSELESQKVAARLVSIFGGSLSKELGIELDKGDEEVEKWFLAVVLLNKSSNMDMSKQILKSVLASGICKLTDTLSMSQEQLAEVLERVGYVSYSQRTAARLQRLATQLMAERGGTICGLKDAADAADVHRQLSTLLGLSPASSRLFLRELRGVWPSVGLELSGRAKNAARHLRLNVNLPPTDARDLEAALTKFGQVHARHYRDCPGGSQCTVLQNDQQDLR